MLRHLLLWCLLLPLSAYAQLDLGLVSRYSFESNLGDAQGGAANLGVAEGVVDYDCGVSGTALRLDQAGDFVRIPGGATNNVNRVFASEDFSVSLYFKAIGGSGANQYLLAKRDTVCTDDQYFFIRYSPSGRILEASLRQGDVFATIVHPIRNQACFQHLVLVREDRRLQLYLNGEEVGNLLTDTRLDVDNAGDLLIGSTTCQDAAATSFTGLIDELRIYNRALEREDVQALYLAPDRVLTQSTNLFLGESIDVEINSPCGTTFAWRPTEGVSDPSSPEPTITPTTAGRVTYTLQIADGQSNCRAVDSLVLNVIDPDALDCSQIVLPKAFTPNGIGPVENETFGIANPFAVPELLSFEIYDRYNGQVFRTEDAFDRWDGTFRGQPVNAGVAFWRVVYRCEGEEVVLQGSVTVLR